MNKETVQMELSCNPWYKERWPWLLMLGPFITIVFTLTVGWYAYQYRDPVTDHDYYEDSLKAGRIVAKNKLAAELGIQARMRLTGEHIEVDIASADHSKHISLPALLRLALSHPTRAGMDQTIELQPSGSGRYTADLRLPTSGHWIVLIEDDLQTWRLFGEVVLPAREEIVFSSDATEPAPDN
jgi:hypothetical protein